MKKASIKKILPFILKWEGGFVNHPNDPGGATNMGVTIGVWKQQGYDKNGDRTIDVTDLKLLTKADVEMIMKKNYWDRWIADNIKSQAVANVLVDWVWCSGKWGIVIPQRLIGVSDDGIVGYLTLEALNETICKDEKKFLQQLYKARYNYIDDIIRNNSKLSVFKKGWINRMKDLEKFNNTL
jgi:lysozyme family protein